MTSYNPRGKEVARFTGVEDFWKIIPIPLIIQNDFNNQLLHVKADKGSWRFLPRSKYWEACALVLSFVEQLSVFLK
jgi:hypothetical protein